MEREAFRQRMQQYKQARESNPQLKYWDWKKENDLGYQLYKINLPSNLQVETDDYDLYGAYESDMLPELNEDGTYHLGSRDPYTGRILKSKQHPTYQKAIESEISAGYFPYEKNNITYTKTYSPVDISGYAEGSSGIPGEWKRNPDGSLVMVEDENGEKVPVKSQQKYDYGNKIRSTSPPRLTEEEHQQIEIRNQRRADKIRHEVNLVQGALNDIANNRPSSNVITEARKKQEESAVDKFYPYKLMGNSLLEASKLGLAGAGLINGIKVLRNAPVSTIGQAAELAGMGLDILEGINSVTNKKWAESVENLVQVGSGELGRRNYRPYDEYDAVTGQLKTSGIGKYKGLVGLGVLGNIYQIYDSVNNMTDNIQEADSYSDGGIVDDVKKDNTYVAPIYKEQVFIPATGAQKIKNDYQYKYGSKSPYKGGELEIVSPEFDVLTGIKGMLNSPSKINTLTKELNKNIDISTLNNQLPNNIGWGPKQSIKAIHDSNQNTSLNLYNTNRWDVVYEGANPRRKTVQTQRRISIRKPVSNGR